MKVTQEVIEAIVAKVGLGLSYTQIGRDLGIDRETVAKYSPKILDDIVMNVNPSEAQEQFQELLDQFNTLIGDTKSVKIPKSRSIAEKKNLVINDIHAPFHNEEALAEAIRTNLDADECWVPGDLLDLFTFSRYEKYSQPFSAVEEFQSGRAIIRTLSETFPKVKVMSGNHDDRFIKWLVRDKNIPQSIIKFFELIDKDFCSPLAKMCAPYPNVEVVEPLTLDYAKFPFIHQEGDCILSHAEKFSKQANKAVADVIQWLKSYAEPAGLVKPFRMVIQAHTHQAGKTWNNFGVVGIEGGCLALTPDYASDPKLRGSQRQSVVGYSTVYQVNGVTDRNKSNFIEIE